MFSSNIIVSSAIVSKTNDIVYCYENNLNWSRLYAYDKSKYAYDDVVFFVISLYFAKGLSGLFVPSNGYNVSAVKVFPVSEAPNANEVFTILYALFKLNADKLINVLILLWSSFPGLNFLTIYFFAIDLPNDYIHFLYLLNYTKNIIFV